jgi:hypothetical protein
MAGPERFERPTPSFVAKCSIQLSYGPEIVESHLDYIGNEFLSAIDAHAPLTNSFPLLPSTAEIFSSPRDPALDRLFEATAGRADQSSLVEIVETASQMREAD